MNVQNQPGVKHLSWYSRPVYNAVLDNYIFLVLDSYHQICGARGLLCQNGIPAAIRKDSVHRVARESNINRCGLNIAMAVDLIDKQNVEFAKTTFYPKVSNALEEFGGIERSTFLSTYA